MIELIGIHKTRKRNAAGKMVERHFTHRGKGAKMFWSSQSNVKAGSAAYMAAYNEAIGGVRAAEALAKDSRATYKTRDLFHAAKKRAKNSGRKFTITLEYIEDLIRKGGGRCCISGIEFDWSVGDGSGRRNPFGPSIDRINSDLGYIPGNVRAVLVAVNFGMNQWGEGVYRHICRSVFEKETKSEKAV
jgi:hypothetical protein